MRMKNYGMWCVVVLMTAISVGCQKHNPVLTLANYQQKFDQAEAAFRDRPGELRADDLDAMLGMGESITGGHADLAFPPPGSTIGDMTWSRWECENEVLLVGFAEKRASSVIRMRR